jgi:hypothetical protein
MPDFAVARLPNGSRRGYTQSMSLNFHEVAIGALALDPADRLRLASELIDSVEGPANPAWEAAWTAEIGLRSAAADAREAAGEPRGVEWSKARTQVLRRLASR